MKNPKKEVERLLRNPVITNQGAIYVNQTFPTKTFIQVTLDPFPGHQHERICVFSPEEWVRLVAVVGEAYLTPRKKKSKKEGGKNGSKG